MENNNSSRRRIVLFSTLVVLFLVASLGVKFFSQTLAVVGGEAPSHCTKSDSDSIVKTSSLDGYQPIGSSDSTFWLSDEACLASKTLPLPSFLWTQQLETIREALRHAPANERFVNRTSEIEAMVDQVLQFLQPHRLRRSIRPASANPEQHYLQVQRILRILQERKAQPDSAPKLQILVFGGSVALGSACARTSTEENCAWPRHLQFFLNRYLGFDAVQVTTFAVGATRTNIASMMLNYGLLPKRMLESGPDVIINGYSVNDFQLQSIERGGAYATAFEEFVDSVNLYMSCERDKPLVVYLDDFVTNPLRTEDEDKNLFYSESFNFDIAKLTQWSGIWTISYSDVVRDWAYQGGKEEQLLVDWAGNSRHPTWSGQIAIVVTIFFNIMHAAIEYCQDLKVLHEMSDGKSDYDKGLARAAAYLDPRLRPKLSSRVTTLSSSKRWEAKSGKWRCNGEGSNPAACSFAWIASSTVQKYVKMPNIETLFHESDGWQYASAGTQLHQGLEALEPHAALVLRVSIVGAAKKPNVLSLFYMKSYSEKWKGSVMEGSIHLDNADAAPVTQFSISGYHDRLTSEYFPHKQYFEMTDQPTTVYIRFRMSSGASFKIVGLALCAEEI